MVQREGVKFWDSGSKIERNVVRNGRKSVTFAWVSTYGTTMILRKRRCLQGWLMRKWLSSHLSWHGYFFVTEAGNAIVAALGLISMKVTVIFSNKTSKFNHIVTVILFGNSMACWYMISALSPCWRSILLTTTWHVWFTDENVVTLLAEHTIYWWNMLSPCLQSILFFCLVDIHT